MTKRDWLIENGPELVDHYNELVKMMKSYVNNVFDPTDEKILVQANLGLQLFSNFVKKSNEQTPSMFMDVIEEDGNLYVVKWIKESEG